MALGYDPVVPPETLPQTTQGSHPGRDERHALLRRAARVLRVARGGRESVQRQLFALRFEVRRPYPFAGRVDGAEVA